MSKPVYLLGGGRHGKVVLDALLTAGVAVAGVLDPNLAPGTMIFGVEVLGDDRVLDRLTSDDAVVVNGIGGSPTDNLRRRVYEDVKRRGLAFSTVRHPAAVIGRECALAEGAQVMAGAVLQNRVALGANAVINTRASIDHGCKIADHVFISPGAVLCGDVVIGEGAFIGAGTVIMPEVEVGARAIIGGGAVVIKNVPPRFKVAGNPAVKIGEVT